MRVIHIIPAAFNYFDDIRGSAFSLVEAEARMGVENEAFALQYGRSNEKLSSEVAVTSPSRKFQGMANQTELLTALESFDVINVHVPLLGLMPKLIAFKKIHPEKALVVTYHRPVATPDLFSVYIAWYTKWYLPKLVALADVLVVPFGAPRLARTEPERLELEVNGNIGLTVASDYFNIYHQIVKQS